MAYSHPVCPVAREKQITTNVSCKGTTSHPSGGKSSWGSMSRGGFKLGIECYQNPRRGRVLEPAFSWTARRPGLQVAERANALGLGTGISKEGWCLSACLSPILVFSTWGSPPWSSFLGCSWLTASKQVPKACLELAFSGQNVQMGIRGRCGER